VIVIMGATAPVVVCTAIKAEGKMKLIIENWEKFLESEVGRAPDLQGDAADGPDVGDVDFERSTQGIKSLIASQLVAEDYPVESDEYHGDKEQKITTFSLSQDENLREFLIFALKGLVKELEDNDLKSFPRRG